MALGNKPLLQSAVTDKNPKLGILAIFGCNFIWGLLPLYWRALNAGEVPVEQIIAQRLVWSCLVLFVLLWGSKKLHLLPPIFKSPKLLGGLAVTSLIMSLNWLLYVGMVNSGHVLEASLSAYLGPLATMAMGVLIFKDKLRPLQWVAILLTVIGVGCQIYILGSLPWAVLGMATCSALYGLLRTILRVDSMPGVFMESLLATPVCIAIMLWWHSQGALMFMRGDCVSDLLIIGTGIITAFPMMWLVFGMRNATYTSIGLVNYVSPTMIFLMGIFIFKENFTPVHFVSFVFIWCALALYTWESFRQHKRLEKELQIVGHLEPSAPVGAVPGGVTPSKVSLAHDVKADEPPGKQIED